MSRRGVSYEFREPEGRAFLALNVGLWCMIMNEKYRRTRVEGRNVSEKVF